MARLPPPLTTCAVGSLPHTQAELALQQQLLLDIPTLPQLPRLNPAEYMLPQALEGLPGLLFDAEGRTSIDVATWRKGAPALDERLDAALRGEELEPFEPSPLYCRAWRPFLWEVEQQRRPFAKAQLTGPLTARWAVTLSDGAPSSAEPELEAQITRLVLARALAMAKALAATGATPIVSLDEPGLYAFDKRRPRHLVELQDLAIAAKALSKQGAVVGIHCCSNTDWAALLDLPIDLLSADMRLSLRPLIDTGRALDEYLARGGRLALGIVPTSSPERTEPERLVEELLATLGERAPHVLARSLLSPACGLALRTVPEAERTFDDLRAVQQSLR